MEPLTSAFLIAVMNMVAKVGFDATIAFLKNRGATIDQAIAALEVAATKSLQDYKDEDKAAALAALGIQPAAPETPGPKVVATIVTP